MQEPGTGVISDPSDYHLLAKEPGRSGISAHGINVVEAAVSSALHDKEAMLP